MSALPSKPTCGFVAKRVQQIDSTLVKQKTEIEGGSRNQVALAEDGDVVNDSPTSGLVSTFVLDDSDEEDDGADIDDEYDFDHEKLAEMVKAGADRQKLVQVVEEAMASALERKLARRSGKDMRDATTLAATAAETAAADAGQAWNLEGRMTPGRMTPTEDSAAVPEFIDVNNVALRAQEALARANDRRRRSSAARKHAPAISQAMSQAKERRRQSLATHQESPGEATSQIQEAMQRARDRHRQSVSKAVDVLESAGYDEDGADASEVGAKMHLIQRAMEEARSRHRRSIARAVNELEEPPAVPALNADAREFQPQQVEASVSIDAAAEHANWGQTSSFSQRQVCGTAVSWGETAVGDWGGSSSCSAQAKISQVVACGSHDSYFQQVCQEESYPQQTYVEQTYMNQAIGQQSYLLHDCSQVGHSQPCYQQQGCMQVACSLPSDHHVGGQYAQVDAAGVNHHSHPQEALFQQSCGQQHDFQYGLGACQQQVVPQVACNQSSYPQEQHFEHSCGQQLDFQCGQSVCQQQVAPQVACNQSSYPQEQLFQQSCGQQFDFQCGQNVCQQQVAPQVSYDQASYGNQAYNASTTQFQSIGCAVQSDPAPVSASCTWQYGVQTDSSAWLGQDLHAKCSARDGWGNQQMYSAPWRLGAA